MLTAGLAAALVVSAGLARATTARGSLVTNIVSATFGSIGGGTFAVTYAVTTTFVVDGPDLWFWKMADPWVQMPGGCVRFRLWVWNYSPIMTAYNITISDMIPENMIYKTYSFPAADHEWNGGTGGTWFFGHSANVNGPWAAGEPPDGQGVNYYMKWVLTQLGVTQSAYVEFEACVL